MDHSAITKVVLLVIAAIFFSGCTSPSSFSPSSVPVQSPGSLTTDTGFNHLLLSPEDLPQGLILVGDGAVQASDITDTMRKYGFQKGQYTLYGDTNHPDNKSRVLEQDIMIFNRANASAMLDEYQTSLAAVKNKNSVTLPLPDPDLGEKSFAIKVSTEESSGIETSHYVFGFVQSGIFEVISMDGTPDTYPALVHVAERAAEKARQG